MLTSLTRVVDADEMGYVSAYIVAPSTIYGQSTSPIPRVTLLTNLLLRMSRAVKGVPILADGSNVLNLVSRRSNQVEYTLTGHEDAYPRCSLVLRYGHQACLVWR
jgi:hypothetical protein